MRAALTLVVLLLAGTVSRAEALTIRDVIELTRAGLSDEVLLALIEVDHAVFPTDTATLKSLKEAGVSERVIVALVRSGRERSAPEPPPAPLPPQEEAPPQVVVVEHPEPEVQQVVVPVPVYVPVPSGSRSHRRAQVRESIVEDTYVPFQSGRPSSHEPRPSQPQAPVYWGFGGKLRPDAWGQPPAEGHKPADSPKPSERDGKPGRK